MNTVSFPLLAPGLHVWPLLPYCSLVPQEEMERQVGGTCWKGGFPLRLHRTGLGAAYRALG